MRSARIAEVLDDRLDEIGYDSDWPRDRADDYDAKWVDVAGLLEPATVNDYALPVEHSLLATWLLAGLRNTGDSYDLSGRLLDAVQRRMTSEAPFGWSAPAIIVAGDSGVDPRNGRRSPRPRPANGPRARAR